MASAISTSIAHENYLIFFFISNATVISWIEEKEKLKMRETEKLLCEKEKNESTRDRQTDIPIELSSLPCNYFAMIIISDKL